MRYKGFQRYFTGADFTNAENNSRRPADATQRPFRTVSILSRLLLVTRYANVAGGEPFGGVPEFALALRVVGLLRRAGRTAAVDVGPGRCPPRAEYDVGKAAACTSAAAGERCESHQGQDAPHGEPGEGSCVAGEPGAGDEPGVVGDGVDPGRQPARVLVYQIDGGQLAGRVRGTPGGRGVRLGESARAGQDVGGPSLGSRCRPARAHLQFRPPPERHPVPSPSLIRPGLQQGTQAGDLTVAASPPPPTG